MSIDAPSTDRHTARPRHLGWYLVAALSYIGLGIFHKFLLNWFVGPIWLVAVVVVGPMIVDRVGRRGTVP